MGEHEDLPFREDSEGTSQDGGPARGPDSASRPADRASPGTAAGSEGERGEHEKRRLFERVMPEIVKRVVERAVETGASRLAEGPENLRNFVQDMKLPKEVLHYLYQQIDDTKNGIYRVVAKEIRDVLEQTQFADEITKVLTKLSFEIKTEIRFIPNDAGIKRSEGDEGASDPGEGRAQKLPKPEVTAQVAIKDRGKNIGAPFQASTGTRPGPGGRRGREDT